MIKCRLLIIAAVLWLLTAFSFPVHASNIDEYGKNGLDAFGASELTDFLDEDTRKLLDEMGVSGAGLENIMKLSPSSTVNALLGILRTGMEIPLRGFLVCCGTAMLTGICEGLLNEDEKSKALIGLAGGCFAVLAVFVPASGSLNSCVSAMKLCAGFEKALIPVLAAMLTACGKPTAAISLKGLSFAAAEFVSAFAEETALPLVGTVGALGIWGGMMPSLKLESVSDILRKITAYSLSVITALFSGITMLKGAAASAADNLGGKAVKLVTGTFVPVVGGALNEAFSAFAGSLAALKNGVGIFGIIVFAAIILPSMAEMLMWIIALRAASAFSGMIGCNCCTGVFNGTAYVFSMANTLLLLTAVVFVISSGTVLLTGAGA